MTTGAYVHRRVGSSRNIHIERFIPGSLVLKECVAAIHCGGNGTTYQVISNGVPAVVVPFNNDQKINAWLLKRSGLGLPLSSAELTGSQLKRAVAMVIENGKLKERLEEFRTVLARIDGPQSAADEIRSFLK